MTSRSLSPACTPEDVFRIGTLDGARVFTVGGRHTP